MSSGFCQSEVSGWGNLRGIRVDGQLIPFTTAVGIYNPDFTQLTLSQREGGTRTTDYSRDGNAVTVAISLQYGARRDCGNGRAASSIDYRLTYKDISPGVCDVHIRITSATAQRIGGSYVFLTFPGDEFPGAAAELLNRNVPSEAHQLNVPDAEGRYLSGSATGIRVSSSNNRQIEIRVLQTLDFAVHQSPGRKNSDIQIDFPIIVGDLSAGQSIEATFTITATAAVEASPVTVTLAPENLGRPFAGIGGNFRIQNQALDPLHIYYIFENMRIAYGRVAMPWNAWQPQEDAPLDPAHVAGDRAAGDAMNSILLAMEIAQTLAEKSIPLIISCWSPPAWAVLPQGNESQCGERLDPAKYDAICQSIGSYLIYLRDHYGAEPLLFSFNEPDAGINVRQSPQEHAEAIKRLGAHFKSIGLRTSMLLGDTGDALPIDFIEMAMNDPQAIPFIGAIAFHSWRGATDQQYQSWAEAAARLGVPLFDTEGGNDAQAYNYPNLLREPWYALDEAAEYVRIMRICQPLSILQWQFTENYSVLHADATGKLHPTQRFFNLKQFNLTPPGASWMAVQSDCGQVLPAAFYDQPTGVYAVHLVNNGACRPIVIKGLPESLTQLNIYVTNHNQNMKKGWVLVQNGITSFTIPAQSLITLTSSTGPLGAAPPFKPHVRSRR